MHKSVLGASCDFSRTTEVTRDVLTMLLLAFLDSEYLGILAVYIWRMRELSIYIHFLTCDLKMTETKRG